MSKKVKVQTIEQNISNEKQNIGEITEDCPICMESLGKNDVCVTKCGHKFCTSCLLQSAQNNTDCPLCRTELAPKIDLITSEDLETAYEEGREDGFEEGEDSIRGENSKLQDEVQKKNFEIESLKEKVSMLEEHLEKSKKKWYFEGSKIGIQIHAKYIRSKELYRECDKKPLTIDEWVKLRMENK